MSGASLETSLAALKSDCAESNDFSSEKGGESCSRWMGYHEQPEGQRMAMNQRISLKAMIAYVAHYTGQSEFKIEKELADRFGVPNINFLPAETYERSIALLSEQVSEVA